jgi:hypothetical protein
VKQIVSGLVDSLKDLVRWHVAVAGELSAIDARRPLPVAGGSTFIDPIHRMMRPLFERVHSARDDVLDLAERTAHHLGGSSPLRATPGTASPSGGDHTGPDVGPPAAKPRLTKETLETEARAYLLKNRHRERNPKTNVTREELAKHIGCGERTVTGLKAWKALQAKRKDLRAQGCKSSAGRAAKPLTAKVVEEASGTNTAPGLDEMIAREERLRQRQAELCKLVAEQTSDYESSPLDPDPPGRKLKVKSPKRY